MKLNVSVISKTPDLKDHRDIIRKAQDVLSSLKDSQSSSYIIDRVRLFGESIKLKKNKVLVFEKDTALSCLIKNVLEVNGISAEFAYSESEFRELYQQFCPDIVFLDWGFEKDSNALDIAKNISKDNIKLIFSSSYLNKKEILRAGADIYIPKPYEINDVVGYIKNFLM